MAPVRWIPDAQVDTEWFAGLAEAVRGAVTSFNPYISPRFHKSSPLTGRFPGQAVSPQDTAIFVPAAAYRIRQMPNDDYKVPVHILAQNLGPRESREPSDYETVKVDERTGSYLGSPLEATLYMVTHKRKEFSFYCARVRVLPVVPASAPAPSLSLLSGVVPAFERDEPVVDADPEMRSTQDAEVPCEKRDPYRYLT